MLVKRLVIIPLSRVRGASLRHRRRRCKLRTALCHIFPPKYAINIPITTASPRIFENISIFKILYFENFLPPFWGLWGSCPLFRSSSSLPQALPYLPLHRHPYATLKKYPRKSRKPKTLYTSPITTCTIFREL